MEFLFDYQKFCATTAVYDKEVEREYLVNGLAAEAGEVAGKFAKLVRDTDLGKTNTITAVDALAVAKELGDCCWFIARLCDYIGWDFVDVIDLNVVKLSKRKAEDSLHGSGDER